MARGCHRLIRQGAKLVETVDDVLEEIGSLVGDALRAGGLAEAADGPRAAPHRHQLLLDALGDAPQTVDALVERLGMAPEALGPALLELEVEGRVATGSDGRVMRLHGAAPTDVGARSTT
jgi:DNA processing protein